MCLNFSGNENGCRKRVAIHDYCFYFCCVIECPAMQGVIYIAVSSSDLYITILCLCVWRCLCMCVSVGALLRACVGRESDKPDMLLKLNINQGDLLFLLWVTLSWNIPKYTCAFPNTLPVLLCPISDLYTHQMDAIMEKHRMEIPTLHIAHPQPCLQKTCCNFTIVIAEKNKLLDPVSCSLCWAILGKELAYSVLRSVCIAAHRVVGCFLVKHSLVPAATQRRVSSSNIHF
jgi:hypothetical protein